MQSPFSVPLTGGDVEELLVEGLDTPYWDSRQRDARVPGTAGAGSEFGRPHDTRDAGSDER